MSLARMQGKSQQSLVVCSMPYNLQSRRIECSGSILKSRLSLLYRNTYVVVCRLGAWSTQRASLESGVSVPEKFFGGWTLLCRNYFFFQKAPAFRFYIPGIRDIPGTRDIPGKSARYIASALKTNFFKPATSV